MLNNQSANPIESPIACRANLDRRSALQSALGRPIALILRLRIIPDTLLVLYPRFPRFRRQGHGTPTHLRTVRRPATRGAPRVGLLLRRQFVPLVLIVRRWRRGLGVLVRRGDRYSRVDDHPHALPLPGGRGRDGRVNRRGSIGQSALSGQ